MIGPSEIQWIVLLGGVLTILSIVAVGLALAKSFRNWVRELAAEAKNEAKAVSKKLDTGNGRAIGTIVKDTAAKVDSLETRMKALEVVSETRNELLLERLRVHELEGHKS